MKKLMLIIYVSCLFLLFSCDKKQEPIQWEPPTKRSGLSLYILDTSVAPYDDNFKDVLYKVVSKKLYSSSEDANIDTYTLKKDKAYYFVVKKCEIYEDDRVYDTGWPDVDNVIYESSLLEVIDYACILNEVDNPWQGAGWWGIFYIQNKEGVEDATIAFYDYPNIVPVNLHFE